MTDAARAREAHLRRIAAVEIARTVGRIIEQRRSGVALTAAASQ